MQDIAELIELAKELATDHYYATNRDIGNSGSINSDFYKKAHKANEDEFQRNLEIIAKFE